MIFQDEHYVQVIETLPLQVGEYSAYFAENFDDVQYISIHCTYGEEDRCYDIGAYMRTINPFSNHIVASDNGSVVYFKEKIDDMLKEKCIYLAICYRKP